MDYKPSLHYLSNGLAVILDPMDIVTTSMSLAVQTGGRDESEFEFGITHFMEHIFMKGTPKHPSPRKIKDYIEGKGGRINAITGNSSVRIYGRIISENLYVLAELISDLFKNSLFDETVIENEKSVIQDELRRSLDDKDRNFFYFKVQKLFAGSGFEHRTLGTAENIQLFTREQLLNYKNSRISAKNTAIGISGKIENIDTLLIQLEELFGWLPSFDVSSNSDAKIIPSIAHNLKPEQKQVMLNICFEDIWPQKLENRFKQKCVGRFESALSRRLHDEVRNKNGLVYGIGIGNFGNETASVNDITFSSAAENLEKIVAICSRVSAEIICKKPITKEEFEISAIQMKLNDADWVESAGSRRNKLLGFYHQYGLLYDFYDNTKQRESMTIADAIENTREYFAKPISILTQGPEFSADLKQVWMDNFKI